MTILERSLIRGEDAIAGLAARMNQEDPGASSHWRHFHRELTYRDGMLTGALGFGTMQPPPRGLRALLHGLLQRRFRKMGAGLPAFAALDATAAAMAARQQRAYDLDVMRQALTLAFLKAQPGIVTDGVTCVIGDGFAALSLLLLSQPGARVVLVNLTKTLLVDFLFAHKVIAANSTALAEDEDGLRTALADPSIRLIGLRAANHALLQDAPADLAVNIASMQEMDPPVSAAYFDDLRAIAAKRPLAFYCCNREEKRLPDGTVSRFADYPWRAADRVLVDELCPWHQHYYALRPPFYRPYDGPTRHRLAWLDGDDAP